jgi:hypothetical protein
MDRSRKKYFDYRRVYMEVKGIIGSRKINDCIIMLKQLNKYCFDCMQNDEQIRLMKNINTRDYNTMRTHWRHLCLDFLKLQPSVDRLVSSNVGFSVNKRFDEICYDIQQNISMAPRRIGKLPFKRLKEISDTYHTLILDVNEFMGFLKRHCISDTPLFVFWNTETNHKRFPLKAWLMTDKLEWNATQLQNLLNRIDNEIRKRKRIKSLFHGKTARRI